MSDKNERFVVSKMERFDAEVLCKEQIAIEIFDEVLMSNVAVVWCGLEGNRETAERGRRLAEFIARALNQAGGF